jgi:hypothetical protein
MIGTREFTHCLGSESVISIPTKTLVLPLKLRTPHGTNLFLPVSSHV